MGAGRLHVLRYAIVPRVRPVAAGVCGFRRDINTRESTAVLGIVGSGGLSEPGSAWGRGRLP
jgi:ABC-type phosphate/phosphonate transport system permease subunit